MPEINYIVIHLLSISLHFILLQPTKNYCVNLISKFSEKLGVVYLVYFESDTVETYLVY